jgi:hypothetical protein
MALKNDLTLLKHRLLHFQTEESNESFDKWLVRQTLREDVSEFYQDLITDLMTELEILQVATIEVNQPALRKTVHYSATFVEEIMQQIDSRLRKMELASTKPVEILAA